jgi:hypothetical protein
MKQKRWGRRTRLRVGQVMPVAAKGVRWRRNVVIRSGKAFRVRLKAPGP